MDILDTFTAKQLDTYTKIHNLEEELIKNVDLGIFVLNPRVAEIQEELDEVRAHCDHIFENGKCIVCGKEDK